MQTPDETKRATDSGGFHERAERHAIEDGKIRDVRIVDDEEGTVSARTHQDGTTSLELTGRPIQGEAATDRVCRTLVAKLNSLGATWGSPIDVAGLGAKREVGVDCMSTDGSEDLLIQVVRADTSRHLWRTLSRILRIAARYGPSELADILRNTIESKTARLTPAQRRELVLALDASQVVSHALAPAVNGFRSMHGSWAADLGYRSIWVVGTSAATTSRLDG